MCQQLPLLKPWLLAHYSHGTIRVQSWHKWHKACTVYYCTLDSTSTLLASFGRFFVVLSHSRNLFKCITNLLFGALYLVSILPAPNVSQKSPESCSKCEGAGRTCSCSAELLTVWLHWGSSHPILAEGWPSEGHKHTLRRAQTHPLSTSLSLSSSSQFFWAQDSSLLAVSMAVAEKLQGCKASAKNLSHVAAKNRQDCRSSWQSLPWQLPS